jgi:hypothetical protein
MVVEPKTSKRLLAEKGRSIKERGGSSIEEALKREQRGHTKNCIFKSPTKPVKRYRGRYILYGFSARV